MTWWFISIKVRKVNSKREASVQIDRRTTGKKEPPGPRGHPLWGSMLDFQRDQLAFILDVARQHGEVAKYRIANLTFYQVNHPEGVKRVLQDNYHNYVKGDLFEKFSPLIGHGLFVSDGPLWLRQRRLMQPAFHRQQIAIFGQIMTGSALQMLERWETAAHTGQPLEVFSEMTGLTMQVVTQALFSAQLPGTRQALSRAITTLLDHVAFTFEVPFYPPVQVPLPRNLRLRRALQELDRLVYAIIRERREHPVETGDLLSMLMEARDEDTGAGMTEKQLRDEVLTLFLAGHETTANTLTWTFYLLSQQPAVVRQLHAELDQVLGGRVPTPADYPSLAYTRMVIEESMRLYPPAWITNRTALVDDEICGYHIPAGAYVAVSPYVTQRDPALWPDPERFDPQRFAPERGAERPRFAYFPFGGGPHQCIGQGFAQLEAALVLATVAQRYHLELVPDHPVEVHASVTLRPRRGLKMTVQQRV